MDLLQQLELRWAEESAKYFLPNLLKVDNRSYLCKAVGCSRHGYAKGYCNAHLIRLKKGMDMSIPIRNRKKHALCSECGVVTNSKGGWGMCTKHFKLVRARLLKEILVEYLGGICTKCKEKFPPVCYDFHHTDPTTKEYGGIAKMVTTSSLEKIAEEVKKCELMCSNCHRIHHFNSSNEYEL